MPSPDTIQRRVKEYGKKLSSFVSAHISGTETDTVIPDGTKCHSRYSYEDLANPTTHAHEYNCSGRLNSMRKFGETTRQQPNAASSRAARRETSCAELWLCGGDATRAERGPGYTAATFVFLDKLSTVDLYLDGDPERTIDAAQPADLLEPSNMEHLDQPLFLLGHGVENPADGIHGDEEYLYVVELPMENPFDEPTERTVKVSGHSAFPRWDGPTDEAFEQASWQFHGSLEDALAELVRDEAVVK
jgi:hypothetical protein